MRVLPTQRGSQILCFPRVFLLLLHFSVVPFPFASFCNCQSLCSFNCVYDLLWSREYLCWNSGGKIATKQEEKSQPILSNGRKMNFRLRLHSCSTILGYVWWYYWVLCRSPPSLTFANELLNFLLRIKLETHATHLTCRWQQSRIFKWILWSHVNSKFLLLFVMHGKSN